jgi:hypothetical protein
LKSETPEAASGRFVPLGENGEKMGLNNQVAKQPRLEGMDEMPEAGG